MINSGTLNANDEESISGGMKGSQRVSGINMKNQSANIHLLSFCVIFIFRYFNNRCGRVHLPRGGMVV